MKHQENLIKLLNDIADSQGLTGDDIKKAHASLTKLGFLSDGALAGEGSSLSLTGEPLEKKKSAGDYAKEIYDLYPRKVGKRAALKAIERAIKRSQKEKKLGFTFASIRLKDRTQKYANLPTRDPKFTPHPSTWFNQDRYDDEELDVPCGGPQREEGVWR